MEGEMSSWRLEEKGSWLLSTAERSKTENVEREGKGTGSQPPTPDPTSYPLPHHHQPTYLTNFF